MTDVGNLTWDDNDAKVGCSLFAFRQRLAGRLGELGYVAK